jgi:hypothetical protein
MGFAANGDWMIGPSLFTAALHLAIRHSPFAAKPIRPSR